MITTTHAVINAYTARRTADRTGSDVRERIAFVVGGLAPDLVLYLLVAGAFVYYPVADGLDFAETNQKVWDDLFFNSPWWTAGHNLLHAPFMLIGLFATASLLKPPWRRRLRFFAVGALLHSVIDIFVHHDDGPLLFFPVSWSFRFTSPVSYWDPDHYGWLVQPFDLAITVVGIVWLLRSWRRRRREQVDAPPPQTTTLTS